MDKQTIEAMAEIAMSSGKETKSLAQMLMDGMSAQAKRKQLEKNRYKQMTCDDVYFDTQDMVLYLQNLAESQKYSESAYHMGFITKDLQVTKKGLKFIRNNS